MRTMNAWFIAALLASPAESEPSNSLRKALLDALVRAIRRRSILSCLIGAPVAVARVPHRKRGTWTVSPLREAKILLGVLKQQGLAGQGLVKAF
jgi:hypothetical protein